MKKSQHVRCLIALLLMASLLVSACGANGTAASMRLVRTEGMVEVADEEGAGIALEENLRLYSGYNVGTLDASYAWINLDNVKLTKMDRNSEVRVEKEGKNLKLEVKSGSLFFYVTEPLAEDETMSIHISDMAVGIRGTCGWVDAEKKQAALLEGKIRCEADGERAIKAVHDAFGLAE